MVSRLNESAVGADGEIMVHVAEQVATRPSMMMLQVFVYLQVLDFLTTILGLRLGLGEASPFIRMLTQWGPAVGVALSKLVAISLAAIALWLNRQRVIHIINYWFAGLVAWNLSLMIYAVATH